MILIAEQKDGTIQLNESLSELMNNLIVDLRTTNNEDYTAISKDLKVRWLADSYGNWALHLLASTDSHLYKIAPSLQ